MDWFELFDPPLFDMNTEIMSTNHENPQSYGLNDEINEKNSFGDEEIPILDSALVNDFNLNDEQIDPEAGDMTFDEQSTHTAQGEIIGMEFDTIELVDEFWNQYGRKIGFGGRIHYTNKSRKEEKLILGRVYVCSREGKKVKDIRRVSSKPRPESRCHCPVKMVASLDKKKGKFIIKSFQGNHNHGLMDKRTIHLIRAHRVVDKNHAYSIDIGSRAGLAPSEVHRLMCIEAGGSDRVGCTLEDVKSYLRTKRTKNLHSGDATAIIDYFDKQSTINPSFFRRFQFDNENQITNFFWADDKMLSDYQAFGDVMTFDTTFGTNKESRPLGIFTGYNNHRQTVVFGGALLYDEKAESFTWLFNVFIECHKGKFPGIIFTDQDPAMKSALEVVMRNVRHGLCSWHISENAIKNLKGIMGNQFQEFLKTFHKCMYEYLDIKVFEEKWKNMLEKYQVVENSWLKKIYEKKDQWCLAYMKNIFTAGIRSTQLSECVNFRLKKHLGGGMSMEKFFNGFDLFLMGVRDKESESECKSRQTSPYLAAKRSCILKQTAELYTPNVFQLFFEEWDTEHGIWLDDYLGSTLAPHVRVANDGERKYEVNFDPCTMTVSCTCCKYEMRGYLCGHILRVFNLNNIREIPNKYIMKRWTINAKNDFESLDIDSPELTREQKFHIISSEYFKLARRVSFLSNENFEEYMRLFVRAANVYVDKHEDSVVNDGIINAQASKFPSSVGVYTLKKKDTMKSRRKRRFPSYLEKGKKGKKAKGTATQESESPPAMETNCSSSQVHGHHEDSLGLFLGLSLTQE